MTKFRHLKPPTVMDTTPPFLFSATVLLMVSLLATAAATPNITTDQSALLALKAHITHDPLNILATNWSANSNSTLVCSWIGVICGARHLRVTALNLSFMGITGTIPPHLGNLSFLVRLQFMNNSFHGFLPGELAHLRRLKYMNFFCNNLRGVIPPWIGTLPKLQKLFLYGNQLSGPIPTAIFNMSSLQVINLGNNSLSGSIPREFGNLTKLKLLKLDENDFEGEIPEEISNLIELEYLNLEYNALTGSIPLVLFNMSSLKVMGLGGNNISGSLPDTICQHLPVLEGLYLSQNQLGGLIPSKLWQCRKLQVISLSYNNFSGSIPRNIGNLTQLTVLYLDFNNLTGTIPNEIGNLCNLKVLSFDVNNLIGPFPSTIFNISTIRFIEVGSNQVSGSLPSGIGVLPPNLEKLLIGQNKFTGRVPKSIANASKLTLLDLSGNSFSGFIPDTLGSLTRLELLGLNDNELTSKSWPPESSILNSLTNCKSLRILDLSNNPLNIMFFPNSLGNLSTSLQHLYLDNCKLGGNISEDIGNLTSLTILSLGFNELTGSIPKTIGGLRQLQGLSLTGNKLQGILPRGLCQLANVFELSLDNNKLFGPIPACLGDLISLRTLSLGSNKLTSIPSTIWGLKYILYLNMSSNSLTGPLPPNIGNLKVVTTIDLSNNQFSGIIPSSIGGLQDLASLSLSHNKLEGFIPESFGNLVSLEGLDLSINNISGVIPKSLEKILYLKNLNLSFNRLHGEIPNGGCFVNFSAQSFMGNDALCGTSRLQVPTCKTSTRSRRTSSLRVLKYTLPAIGFAILILVLIFVLIKRKKRNMKLVTEADLSPLATWRKISYQELVCATEGFNESNLLGTGSFGTVFRGTLSDGLNVAIKSFNLELEGALKTFDAECEVLCNLRHRNLIKIISSCSNLDFKALVLRYMPCGSLEKWLYSHNYCLTILQRLNIMIDVASALEYLHHGCSTPVVHCDLKPSNVLLDEDLVAHLADFGIAKLLGGADSMTQTMTLATIGYMAPEYGSSGVVSVKGDVYSYGILLMETFARKKPTDVMFAGEMSLKHWVKESFPHAVIQIADTNILREEEHFDAKKNCVSSIMELALDCSAESPGERINMTDALAKLKKIKGTFLKDFDRV